MMSYEQLKEYVERLNLTHEEVAKQYIKDDGKPAGRSFVTGLLIGKQELSQSVYSKLVKAINTANGIKNLG